VTDIAAIDLRLTEWTSCGGCAAKWGASPLSGLVRELAAAAPDPALLIGLAPFDDAAVYQVSDDVAMVSTTDFFPPLVDDPSDFGAIAAANACSDVFAMGGRVVMALNVAAFPERLPVEAIQAIFSAAAAKVTEAGGLVAGGHTIRSEEPIFGLAVQGLVHPGRVWAKSGALAGDVLVLSKPLGTGIVLAGAADDDKRAAIAGMKTLNRAAAEALTAIGPHAVTDVTGFGLFGHGWEMADRSGARLVLEAERLPLYPGARAAADGGTRTGGDARNRAYLEGHVTVGEAVHPSLEALAYDPQTSGGLLAAVPAPAADQLAAAGFTVIGRVEAGDPGVSLV
jgi:selenide,water dikinase